MTPARRRIVLLLGVAVLVVAAARLLGRSQPRPVGRPLESLGAELLFLDAHEIVQRGSSTLVVVRLNEPVELVPQHFASAGLTAPAPIDVWADHLSAPVVFNAGQFDENHKHLGWLKANGEWISRQRKDAWKGLLVSGPLGHDVWARVVDLEYVPASIEERYRHAVQSMMLVDDQSEIRVRDTDISACRTVVGEDERGRILILLTEGAVTLADLARWLPKQRGLGLVRAMNLDGGVESQLAIRTPEVSFSWYGQIGTGTTVFEGSGPIRFPIPAVIAVRPDARKIRPPAPGASPRSSPTTAE